MGAGSRLARWDSASLPRLQLALLLGLVLGLGAVVERLSAAVLRPPLVIGQDTAYPGAVGRPG